MGTNEVRESHVPPVQPAKVGSRRLIGIDVARGLAVLGMFAVHLGPEGTRFSPSLLQMFLAGKSAALFAVLAGVSLALLSGGSRPYQGDRHRYARRRIAIRAVLVFVLGVVLASLGSSIEVILACYGVYFLLALPALRLRPHVLAVMAVSLAILGPVLSFGIRHVLPPPPESGMTVSLGSFTSLDGLVQGAEAIMLTGAYPAITWMPFVFAGMAVGRLDLRNIRVQNRLVAFGVPLALLGYGGSWLTLHVFGGLNRLLAVAGTTSHGRPVGPNALANIDRDGIVPTTDPAWLLVSSPHSGTPFEVIGATGVALAVIGCCLLLATRIPGLLTPLADVGALALTSYTLQILALAAIGDQVDYLAVTVPWLLLTSFVVGVLLFCTLWRSWRARGPLEYLLHRASTAWAE